MTRFAVLALVLALILALATSLIGHPVGRLGTHDASPTSDTAKTLVHRLFDAGWNRGNAAVFDELVSPDHAFHVAGIAAVPRGPEGYRWVVSTYRSAFPDLRFAIEDLVAEGDRVAVRWTAQGSQPEMSATPPPIGRGAVAEGMSLHRIADGQIAESWSFFDPLGPLQLVRADPATPRSGEGGEMALLHVALEEGFVGEMVVIQVDGREVFRESGVKTRLQTGLADSVETDVPPGVVRVDIDLPERGVSEVIEVQVSDRLYLGVSVAVDGQIVHRVSREPFGYL